MLWNFIFLSCGLLGIAYGLYTKRTTHKLNTYIDECNYKINKQHENLLKKQNLVENQIKHLSCELKTKQEEKIKLSHDIAQMIQQKSQAVISTQKTAEAAMQNYYDVLEHRYSVIDSQFDTEVQRLKDSFNQLRNELQVDFSEEQQKLEQLKATRIAAQDALRKEKEIKEQKEFYCLTISTEVQQDIQKLEMVKGQLSNPRILSMLIWQTFFQKALKQLSANILGIHTTCGIYKITNQVTDECYIGQSVDIAKRWAEHAKCGLGIDTPPKNKLYAAMQEHGLWNFSWELLEECSREELDEKEAYYIEMYMSNNYGYNSTSGNHVAKKG